MKKILVLDNYDSFTYNLVHILREMPDIGQLEVVRNNKISIKDVEHFSHVLLSPGPGLPSEAGIMPKLLKTYAATKSIMGVCLGHQAIAEAFGGTLSNLPIVFHGIVSEIHTIANDPLFAGLPDSFSVCRYHSWVVNEHDLPNELIITSKDEHDSIMSLRHQQYQVFGVQFHPESVMTQHGKAMVENWLNA